MPEPIWESDLGATTMADDWVLHQQRGGQAMTDGDYVTAEKELLAALEQAEKSKSAEHLTDLLGMLGEIYLAMRNMPALTNVSVRLHKLNAECNYELAIAVAAKLQAKLYAEVGEYEKAAPLFRNVLAIRKKHLPDNHMLVAKALIDVGIMDLLQKRVTDAEAHCMEALNIMEQHVGPASPELIPLLHNLALIYEAQEKFELAEKTVKQSLLIAKAHYGKRHHTVAKSLQNLAMFRTYAGQHAEAEPLFQESISIFAQSGPRYSRELAGTMRGYAKSLRAQGRIQDAQLIEASLDPAKPS
jgi:tetratricopeptide (TPR) repeat protein